MPRILATFLTISTATLSSAAELLLEANNVDVVNMININYPEKLVGNLTSGLSTVLLVQTTLQSNDVLVAEFGQQIVIKYDLWDEIFQVKKTVNGLAEPPFNLADTTTVLAYLNNLEIKLPQLSSHLNQHTQLTINTTLLLDPIAREQMALIRQFVAENSVPGSVGTSGGDAKSNNSSLFNLIFQQYSNGIDVGAIWSTSTSVTIMHQ